MATVKRLPAGFRYLFTAKAMKALAAAAGAQSATITTGNITTAGRLPAEAGSQAHFQTSSLDAYYADAVWHFRFHQSGFRQELLPPAVEEGVKAAIQATLAAFIRRVLAARETDFLRSPGIWTHVTFTNGKAAVSYTEHK